MRYVEESASSASPARISDFTLAVIPIGSGNDWIRIHNIDYNIADTVSLIRDNSFVLQDVVKVTALTPPAYDGGGTLSREHVSYMVNIGGVGFDARVCERVNGKKAGGKRSKLLYINALLYLLFHYESVPMAVYCDGDKVFEGKCFSVALGTGRYCGGGLRQTPCAEYDDGLLDYTIIPKTPLLKVVRELPRLFNGTLHQSEYVISGKCRSLQIVPMDE